MAEHMIEFKGTPAEIQKILNAASPVSVKAGCPAVRKKRVSEGHVRIWFAGDNVKVNDLAKAIRDAAKPNPMPRAKVTPKAEEDKDA